MVSTGVLILYHCKAENSKLNKIHFCASKCICCPHHSRQPNTLLWVGKHYYNHLQSVLSVPYQPLPPMALRMSLAMNNNAQFIKYQRYSECHNNVRKPSKLKGPEMPRLMGCNQRSNGSQPEGSETKQTSQPAPSLLSFQ